MLWVKGTLIICAVLTVLIMLLGTTQYLEAEVQQDLSWAVTYMGEPSAGQIQYRSTRMFEALTGWIPEEWGDKSAWTRQRRGVLELQIYQLAQRLAIIQEWLKYIWPVIIAALIDGLVRRKIAKEERAYANPVRYNFGIHVSSILLTLPVLYLFVPISVHPMFVLTWLLFLILSVRMITTYLQHRL